MNKYLFYNKDNHFSGKRYMKLSKSAKIYLEQDASRCIHVRASCDIKQNKIKR